MHADATPIPADKKQALGHISKSLPNLNIPAAIGVASACIGVQSLLAK
jgi:hypothetical protein